MTTSSKAAMLTLSRLFPFVAACVWTFPANAENLVTNGTFDGTTYAPWWPHAAEGLSQDIEVSEGRLCSTIVEGGENVWDVILGLSGLGLVAGQNYHLTFSASADADRSIHIKTGLGAAPYTDYFMKPVKLTPAAQVFDYTFLNLKTDAAGQLQFQIGGSPGTVCFDNIIFESVEPPVVPPYTTPSLTGHVMKDYAGTIEIGTAVDTPTFLSMPLHNAIVAGEFSMMTPANAMKMNMIQPTQGVFDWVETDALLTFAEQNGLEFRGHPLVWHTQVPGWLNDGTFDRDAMIQIMYSHIDALMGHYVGRIPTWDVVNEAIDKVGDAWGFRSTIWHDRIGADFVDLAFQRAHLADPTAKLLYNDYNIEQMGDPKAERVYQLISDMVSRGIPIHQVGFQGHYYVTPDGGVSGLPDMAKIRANMDRYAQIGIDVQITECDFRVGLPLDDAKQQMQSQFYADLLRVCIDAPNCSHFTVWGLSDVDSWVPSTFPEYDSAHIFDSSLTAKSSYHALTQVLASYGEPVPVGVGGSGGVGGQPAAVVDPSPRSSDDSGCSFYPAKDDNETTWHVELLTIAGFSLLYRRKLKKRVVS